MVFSYDLRVIEEDEGRQVSQLVNGRTERAEITYRTHPDKPAFDQTGLFPPSPILHCSNI